MNLNSITRNVNTYNSNDKPLKNKQQTKIDSTKHDSNAVVYEKNTEDLHEVDIKEVNRLLEESKKSTQRMADLFEKLIFNQVKANSIANGTSLLTEVDNIFDGIKVGDDVVVEISEDVRLQAQKDVAEGGYYSVDATSDRIVDFAKALANGDPSKLDLLRDAIDDGFAKAKELWNDDMPQISLDTYDAVMEKFDKLEESFKG